MRHDFTGTPSRCMNSHVSQINQKEKAHMATLLFGVSHLDPSQTLGFNLRVKHVFIL